MTLRVMYELKKIGPGSAARMGSIFFTVLYAFFVVILAALGKIDNINLATSNGIVTIALGIIITAIIGAATCALLAVFYNLLGRRGGGLHLQFHLMEEPIASENSAKRKK